MEGVRAVVLLEGSGVRIEVVLLCCLLFCVCWKEKNTEENYCCYLLNKVSTCGRSDPLKKKKKKTGRDGWLDDWKVDMRT